MSEPSISVVSVFVDTPKATPITRKLSEICREHPDLRVWGINRRSFVVEFYFAEISIWYHDLEMTWSDNWNAWFCRCAEGQYQQFCIFVPREDDE